MEELGEGLRAPKDTEPPSKEHTWAGPRPPAHM
uniref:Uncharacterized protein n=1 Tax=Trichinella nativa TaxID=6335 RepID=A0A0V1KHK0_9BILA